MAQEFKIPNIGKGEAGTNTVTIEEFFEEVYNYNHSEAAVRNRKRQWKRISIYCKHFHNDMTPQEVWKYIRVNTKNDIDERHSQIVEFLRGYIKFLRTDHPDIPNDLHFVSDPSTLSRKTYVTHLHDSSIGSNMGGCKTFMSRIGGITVPNDMVRTRDMGIPKVIKKGTYDVEEDEGKPLTAKNARYIIEALAHKKAIAICYFMNYTGFRSGEVYDVKKSDLQWDEKIQILKVRMPAKSIKETITKGWRYLDLPAWEKISPLLEGLSDGHHPFRYKEEQKLHSFENAILKKLRNVYNSHPELSQKDTDNGRYFFNVHSWRARCSTEYSRTQGIDAADGYIRHARGLMTYYKKTKEEREAAFLEACPDLAIYQVDKKESESKLKDMEISKMEEQAKEIKALKDKIDRLAKSMSEKEKKIFDKLIKQEEKTD